MIKLRAPNKKRAAFALAWAVLAVLFALSEFFGRGVQGDAQGNNQAALSVDCGDTLRVCTFNLRNYLVTDRLVEGRWRKAYPKPEAEKSALAAILKDINAHVLLLQEMGGKADLEDLLRRLDGAGMPYPYFALSNGADPERRLCILSKIPLEDVFTLDGGGFMLDGTLQISARGLLTAKIRPKNGIVIRLATLHLKSKYGAKKADKEFEPFREAELKGLLTELKKKTDKDPVLIGGDFNDDARGPLSAIIENSDFKRVSNPSGDTPYTYFWKKGKGYYVYDFFVTNPAMAGFLSGAKFTVYGIRQDASDHSAAYLDIPLTRE